MNFFTKFHMLRLPPGGWPLFWLWRFELSQGHQVKLKFWLDFWTRWRRR